MKIMNVIALISENKAYNQKTEIYCEPMDIIKKYLVTDFI